MTRDEKATLIGKCVELIGEDKFIEFLDDEFRDYLGEVLIEAKRDNDADDVLCNNTITLYCDDKGDNNEPVGLYYITAKDYFNIIIRHIYENHCGKWEDDECDT